MIVTAYRLAVVAVLGMCFCLALVSGILVYLILKAAKNG